MVINSLHNFLKNTHTHTHTHTQFEIFKYIDSRLKKLMKSKMTQNFVFRFHYKYLEIISNPVNISPQMPGTDL